MKSFGVLTFLLALATASPVAVSPAEGSLSLEKRDTEVIYLANCRSLTSCCSPETHYSQIAVGSPKPPPLASPKAIH